MMALLKRHATLLFICLIVICCYVNLNSGLLTFNSELLSLIDASPDKADLINLIFVQVRLPRILLGLSVGFVLGASGAVMQGFLRNPLAGPDLLGITNCAALGAVIMLYFGFASISWFMLPLGGMLGASLSIVLIFLLAGKSHSTLNIILAGVAINAVAASLISLALNFSNNPYAMSEIVYWLMGSFNNRSLNDVLVALPFMFIGTVILFFSARFLDALSLGEDTAKSLGFNLKQEQAKLVFATALTVGSAVAVCGNIGFVGLVVPHICRPFVGYQPSKLILISGLCGAVLVLFADILVQRISLNQELKLGVVTSLIGGPFFLYLIYHLRRRVN